MVRVICTGEHSIKVTTETIGNGVTLTKLIDNNGNRNTRLKIIKKVPYNKYTFLNTIRRIDLYDDKFLCENFAERFYDEKGSLLRKEFFKGSISGSSVKNYFQKLVEQYTQFKG